MTAGGQRKNQAQAPEERGRGGCNLEPLRTDGPDALRPPNIPEILKIRLVEIELLWEGPPRCVEVLKGDDLFDSVAMAGPLSCLIPRTGCITRAVFTVEFSDSPHPVTVQISAAEPPALPSGSDTEFLKRWLTQSGFCA